MPIYRFLADVIVISHAAYAGFIVLGLVAILVGTGLGWSWVRNFWFRLVHLVMIAVVAGEAALGITCPLTALENYVRQQAGQGAYTGSFIGKLAHDLLFFEAPEWVLSGVHILFFVAVLATFVWARPAWPGRRRRQIC